MNSRGFTILETLVAVATLGFAVFVISQSFTALNRSSQLTTSHEEADYQLIMAVDYIEKVGRVSQWCEAITTSSPPSLVCQIDLNRPASPTDTLTWVQFSVVSAALQRQSMSSNYIGSTLQYQSGSFVQGSTNNNGVFTSTKVIQSFPYVGSFAICDDTSMTSPSVSDPACTIQSSALSALRAANQNHPGNFFRFLLTEAVTTGLNQQFSPTFQGAFFVRNPTTAWAIPSLFPTPVLYSW